MNIVLRPTNAAPGIDDDGTIIARVENGPLAGKNVEWLIDPVDYQPGDLVLRDAWVADKASKYPEDGSVTVEEVPLDVEPMTLHNGLGGVKIGQITSWAPSDKPLPVAYEMTPRDVAEFVPGNTTMTLTFRSK